jgi:hypothetical protein
MTLFRTLAFAGALAATMVASPAAHATTFMKTTLEQRVDFADIIVRGTVAEVWTEQDESGTIWTRAQLEVTEVFKGDETTEVLIVDQLGGSWAGMHMDMPGAARFSPGEEVLVLVEDLRSGHRVPISMSLGKYTVVLDPRLRTDIAVQFAVPHHRAYDHRFIPLPKEDAVVSVDDLGARIRAHAAKGVN